MITVEESVSDLVNTFIAEIQIPLPVFSTTNAGLPSEQPSSDHI